MLKVSDIMTRDVLALDPSSSLRDAAELFAKRHLTGAPVLDGGAIVGVVSMADILEFIISAPTESPANTDEAPADDDEPLDEMDEEAAPYFVDLWDESGVEIVEPYVDTTAATWDRLATHVVAEVMTRDAIAVTPATPVSVAARCLRAADVHRVLVVDRGTLLGIVTTTDIVRAVADDRITLTRDADARATRRNPCHVASS